MGTLSEDSFTGSMQYETERTGDGNKISRNHSINHKYMRMKTEA